VTALEDAGVPTLPIKGTTLADRVHGETGLRPTTDVDVLVPRAQIRSAVEVLRALGYAAPEDPVWTDGLPEMHYTFGGGDAAAPRVELHWRVHASERSRRRRRRVRDRDADRCAPLDGPAEGGLLAPVLRAALPFVRSTYGLRDAPTAVVAGRGALHALGTVVKRSPRMIKAARRSPERPTLLGEFATGPESDASGPTPASARPAPPP
jgi:Uncharacterised nucleotidyltransferase